MAENKRSFVTFRGEEALERLKRFSKKSAFRPHKRAGATLREQKKAPRRCYNHTDWWLFLDEEELIHDGKIVGKEIFHG